MIAAVPVTRCKHSIAKEELNRWENILRDLVHDMEIKRIELGQG